MPEYILSFFRDFFLVKPHNFLQISSEHIIDLIRSVCDSPTLDLLIAPLIKASHSSKLIADFQTDYHQIAFMDVVN
jgi:hypothetical protein